MKTETETTVSTISEPSTDLNQTEGGRLQNKAEQGYKKAEQGRTKDKRRRRSSSEFFENRKDWTDTLIPAHFQDMSLDEYADLHPDYAEQIAAAQCYVADLLNGGTRTMVAYGPPGSGKTELACAIWNAVAPRVDDRRSYDSVLLAQTADNVAFVAGMELPDYWKRSGNRENRKPAGQHLRSAWFAVLDDLDKCPAGSWSAQLQRLVDARTWSSPKPTVITMNTTPAELVRKYGECGAPILSRFERAGALFLRIGR